MFEHNVAHILVRHLGERSWTHISSEGSLFSRFSTLYQRRNAHSTVGISLQQLVTNLLCLFAQPHSPPFSRQDLTWWNTLEAEALGWGFLHFLLPPVPSPLPCVPVSPPGRGDLQWALDPDLSHVRLLSVHLRGTPCIYWHLWPNSTSSCGLITNNLGQNSIHQLMPCP